MSDFNILRNGKSDLSWSVYAGNPKDCFEGQRIPLTEYGSLRIGNYLHWCVWLNQRTPACFSRSFGRVVHLQSETKTPHWGCTGDNKKGYFVCNEDGTLRRILTDEEFDLNGLSNEERIHRIRALYQLIPGEEIA